MAPTAISSLLLTTLGMLTGLAALAALVCLVGALRHLVRPARPADRPPLLDRIAGLEPVPASQMPDPTIAARVRAASAPSVRIVAPPVSPSGLTTAPGAQGSSPPPRVELSQFFAEPDQPAPVAPTRVSVEEIFAPATPAIAPDVADAAASGNEHSTVASGAGAAILSLARRDRSRRRGSRRHDHLGEVALPAGAEAALAAMLEIRPDPRNVVVTHRDPTAEVRLRPAEAKTTETSESDVELPAPRSYRTSA